MTAPQARLLEDGERLHLQHGPIDLIIGVDGERTTAFELAIHRFENILQEVVDELPDLRRAVNAQMPEPKGETARRMYHAAMPFNHVFVTGMAGVAGAVADTILVAMSQAHLRRAYVNNGGDIAIYLAEGESFTTQMSHADGSVLGQLHVASGKGIGGIATSGRHGRSLSRGIADSVTVVAADAVTADVTATLIANAVDLPRHSAVTRAPAWSVDPGSELGARLVVTHVDRLQEFEVNRALDAGEAQAAAMVRGGQIVGAALFLQGSHRIVGGGDFLLRQQKGDEADV